ncbi:surface-adhesin E family protein [Acinetobacter baumannii]|uniref:surface-adhesin E family protein n=1 Tax=Acinetobacter baumannii TaxID=470 RepID=UPI002DB88ED6|nr:surface-adhesin E family protein [Acinetobacter baumannii]MEB6558775.1 hypothetical protein [Acinetobacter baumannii]
MVIYADWEHYSKDDQRNYYFDIDRAKITDSHSKVISYWTKSVYYADLVKDKITVGDYYLTYYFGNCSEDTLAIKSLALYNKKGDLLHQSTVPTEFNPVIPESRGEYLLHHLCNTVFE